MSKNIGFTGTRKGMTKAQERSLKFLLDIFDVKSLHHGDCIGADKTAARLAKDAGIYVVIHPPKEDKYRAFTHLLRGEYETRPERSYLERNRDIVEETSLLIATPILQEKDAPRSETWFTIRHAKALRRSTMIIWPDGKIGVNG